MAGNLSLGITIGASVAPSLGSAFQTVEERTNRVGKALRQTWSRRDTAANVIHYRDTLQQLKQKQAQLGYSSERLNQGIAEVEQKYREAKSEAKEYGMSVANIDREHRQMADSAAVAERRLGRLQTMQANRAKREELQGQIMGTAGAALAAAQPLRAAMQFEEKMADVKKVVDFDKPEQFEAMGQDILKMSGRMPMAAEGIADIVAAAGQSGIAQDQLQGFAESAVKMGTAFDISGRQAGKMMASWRAGMGLTQEKTESLADAVNHLSNNMNAEAAELAQVVQREGATAKAAGLAAEETAALGAALLAPGTSAERASTAMKKLTGSLTAGEAATKRQREAFQKLGMDAQGLAQRMQEDAQGTITEVFDRIKSMDEAEQGAIIKQIFGEEAKSAIMPLLGQLEELKKAQGLVADQTQFAGSMQAEYEERVQTSSAQMEMFLGKINALGVTLGSVFLPALNNVMGVIGGGVEVVTDLAEQFPLLTQVVVGATVGLVGLKVAALAGKYAVTFLSDGIQIGKAAIDFFRLSTLRTNAALLAYRARTIGAAVGSQALAAKAAMTGWSMRSLGSAIYGMAARAIPAAITGIRAMGVALLTTPVGWIATAIGAAAFAIYKYWGPIGSFFSGLWSGIKAGVGPVLETLSPLAPLGNAIASAFGWVAGKVGDLVGWFASFLAPVSRTKAELGGIAAVGRNVGIAITQLVNLALTPFKGLVRLVRYGAYAWQNLDSVVSAVSASVSGSVGSAWNGLKAVLSWSPLGIVARAWSPLTDWFSSFSGGIKKALGGMWDWVKSQLMAPVDAALDKVGSAWETVKGWFGGGDEETGQPGQVQEGGEPGRDGPRRVGRTAAAATAGAASAAVPAMPDPVPTQGPLNAEPKQTVTNNMGDINITIGSESGDPEEIAERVREELQKMTHQVNDDG